MAGVGVAPGDEDGMEATERAAAGTGATSGYGVRIAVGLIDKSRVIPRKPGT
jgi:hypothetical protein